MEPVYCTFKMEVGCFVNYPQFQKKKSIIYKHFSFNQGSLTKCTKENAVLCNLTYMYMLIFVVDCRKETKVVDVD